jgi:hypothetical protein
MAHAGSAITARGIGTTITGVTTGITIGIIEPS